MFRKLLGVLGLLWMLAPDRLAHATERWATETPGVPELRSWVVPAIRLEGAMYVLLAWRGGTPYAALKKVFGGVGLFALAYPEQFVGYGTRLAYRNPEECEWKPGVYTLARFVGLVSLLVAIDELRRE
ncbi:hypothetical protein AArcSl_1483 [Halalkaliarchaeum desulfuricum]|uniref:DoxX family protein n=1 Tax=Halalkaliarchaeum desulfuricum TaxID=2055893 RepID=A0A343TJ40_9EURY|nr:hypothetical protein [Halalkaliarchaeum desulfuricum]AUX09112.1 hypothetical protein AArcSl_1483 [Halalkaliarchaeum desulfuricum]